VDKISKRGRAWVWEWRAGAKRTATPIPIGTEILKCKHALGQLRFQLKGLKQTYLCDVIPLVDVRDAVN
jgi:hypothetical protein